MLGLASYGSDDSESEATQSDLSKTKSAHTLSPSSSIPLPLKPPRTKRAIFTLVKPSKTPHADADSDEAERPIKKPKLETRKSAGSSSLLAMLPAPSKNITPTPSKSPQIPAQQSDRTGSILKPLFTEEAPKSEEGKNSELIDLFPPSLEKKVKSSELDKKNLSIALAPGADFFSLGTPISASSSKITNPPNSSKSPLPASSTTISSAPTVAEFRPPSPTPLDPYPGYYQLPSGQWAAYDTEYYKKYWETWAAEVGIDFMSQKGFEGASGHDTVEIDAQAQLNLSQKEREERKNLTKKAGQERKEPRMNIKASNISSLAKTRHQLSSLLTDAYANRQALEEKIAQGRRNRKEAGNKYGF